MSAGRDQVEYVNGRTRLFGIVGDPIEQVRSPEMFGAEFERRGANALMVPMHVPAAEFEAVLPALLKLANLDGLVFTIPFKSRAMALADEIGPNAVVCGALNALARRPEGGWRAEIFDGIGCVEAFRRRGFGFAGKSAMLIGAGGAGSAIAIAIAHEGPKRLRLFDVDATRLEALAARVARVGSGIEIELGPPSVEGVDYLLNASPVGMLTDSRLPIDVERLPPGLVVFDAIVKPERTPLLALAEASGCSTVLGREMMRGQISRMVDYFGYKRRSTP
jgi:shikimate dehydrogenase